MSDVGATSSGNCHKINYGFSDGTGGGSYTGATCTGQAGFGAAECATLTCDCNVSVTFNGGFFTVSTSGKEVLASTTTPVPWNCPAVADPQHLNSIAVTPANWTIWNVAGGDGAPTTQQYTATGTYSNGTTSTLTNVVWTSSNPSLATISSTGLAKSAGGAGGTLTITASSGGTSGSTQLTVSYNGDLGTGGGGGGGNSCDGDIDCPENLCCMNGACQACQLQGYWKKLHKEIDKADHHF
jgi:hypothetical protein